ncbi:hypothetical protein LEL_07571 [Akanthomyces lecanii RCEF 1005]|uniref:Elongator complex protein 6 n=1 Tax=Akanthomyces lecanii RCEF 1005 TaxID=1081108 RepID=A0A168FT07_CORDF|nr:hypothetical protein LEL_07571 [Akanthomyces lecanii RCEF 1005]
MPSPAPPPQSQSHSRASSSRVPALLEPHVACGPLARDEGSLTLVTWVQGASANWLLLRYLHSLLGSGPRTEDGREDDVPGVVLVSFLRDARFWMEGCARLGMDLDALCKSRRFGFVDGLTGLYAATMDSQPPPSSSHSAPVPDGDGVIAGRGGGRTATADTIKTQVDGALSRLLPAPPGKRILLVDGLDAYVAMTPPGSASEAESLLMGLRETVHSTLLTLAADEPLMHAAQQGTATATTSLEREQAALVLGQAHAADQVVSLRRLDTGAAADVSGVLRVATRAGGDEGEELLYHVSGDGSVRVFERGA